MNSATMAEAQGSEADAATRRHDFANCPWEHPRERRLDEPANVNLVHRR